MTHAQIKKFIKQEWQISEKCGLEQVENEVETEVCCQMVWRNVRSKRKEWQRNWKRGTALWLMALVILRWTVFFKFETGCVGLSRGAPSRPWGAPGVFPSWPAHDLRMQAHGPSHQHHWQNPAHYSCAPLRHRCWLWCHHRPGWYHRPIGWGRSHHPSVRPHSDMDNKYHFSTNTNHKYYSLILCPVH